VHAEAVPVWLPARAVVLDITKEAALFQCWKTTLTMIFPKRQQSADGAAGLLPPLPNTNREVDLHPERGRKEALLVLRGTITAGWAFVLPAAGGTARVICPSQRSGCLCCEHRAAGWTLNTQHRCLL